MGATGTEWLAHQTCGHRVSRAHHAAVTRAVARFHTSTPAASANRFPMSYFTPTPFTPLPALEPLDIGRSYTLPTAHVWRVRDRGGGGDGGACATTIAFTPRWVCHRRLWRVDGMEVQVCGYGHYGAAYMNPHTHQREICLRSLYAIGKLYRFTDARTVTNWSDARDLWSACMDGSLEYFSNGKMWYRWEKQWDAI